MCGVLLQAMGGEKNVYYYMDEPHMKEVKHLTESEMKELFRRAEAGEAEAQHDLGIYYGQGVGVKKDYAEAFKWVMAAAKQGLASAQCTVGQCYLYGKGVEQNIEEAIKWMEKAANSGDMESCANLGSLYLTGGGGAEIKPDHKKAAIYIRQAAEAGHVGSCRSIGLMYLQGDGVPQNVELGRHWLEKAIAQNDADAKYIMGYKLLSGGEADKKRAVELLEDAVAQGNTDAACMLGYAYYEGDVVPQDKERAARLLEVAANPWNMDAVRILGAMYYGGEGVPQDIQRGMIYIMCAAYAGDIRSQRNMGAIAYEAGKYAEAREWLQKAAEGGDATSMLFLGQMYLEGLGGSCDPQKARKYLESAAAEGIEIPEELQRRLRSSMRTE